MNTASISMRRQWDGKLTQTADLLPRHSAAVLLDVPLNDEPRETELPEALAEALATGLAASGMVAGRWFDLDPVPAAAILWPPPPRNLLRQFMEHLSESWSAPVVTTSSPAVVVRMLDQGWSMQFQLLLVLDPKESGTLGDAVHTLATKRDWVDFAFPPPMRALIAPGVDGDFILVAAATEEVLAEVMSHLSESFQQAGITLVDT